MCILNKISHSIISYYFAKASFVAFNKISNCILALQLIYDYISNDHVKSIVL